MCGFLSVSPKNTSAHNSAGTDMNKLKSWCKRRLKGKLRAKKTSWSEKNTIFTVDAKADPGRPLIPSLLAHFFLSR